MEDRFFEVTTSSFADSSNEEEESGSPRKPASKAKVSKTAKTVKTTHNIVDSFIYHPDLELPDLSAYCGSHVEVKIERLYLTLLNKNVRKRRIFGKDEYTSDSDIACVLLHSGLAKAESVRRRSGDFLSAVFLVKKNRRKYEDALQNGILSRKLNLSVDQSLRCQTIKPVSCKSITSKGSLLKDAKNIRIPARRKIRKRVFEREPPYHERFGELVFNMNNEFAFVYNLTNICDKSEKKDDFLSSLLQDYLLVLETTDLQKYIISFVREELENEHISDFWVKILHVKNPVAFDNQFIQSIQRRDEGLSSSSEVPILSLLPKNFADEVASNLAWHDLTWGPDYLEVQGQKIEPLQSFKFYRARVGPNPPLKDS